MYEALFPLAVALLLSLALGRAAGRVGIPRVTVYLLVGLALGPHGLLLLAEPDAAWRAALLVPATQTPLDGLGELAVGFILFGIGAEFRFEVFRRVGARVLAVSAFEIGLTALLVGLAVLAGTGDWRMAVIAPALAVSSAPSATLVTLREIEAEGPSTRCLILCVGHNNLAALLAFPLLLALTFGGGQALAATTFALAALAGGALLGLAVAVWMESITGRRELVLVGLLTVLFVLGVAHGVRPGATGLAMLGCFAAGMAVANASPHAPQFFRYLENTVYPLYVLFFIGAGRDLHVGALASAGVLGVLFVAARSAGKIFGTRIGLHMTSWDEGLSPLLGAGLLCQAGVALGLVAVLETVAPEASADLRHVVVASVVFFELVGPLLLRRTAIAAGEVKLANLVPHAEARGVEAVRWVWTELRRNLGLVRADLLQADGAPTVRHAMRRSPRTIPESAPFERVMRALGESGADVLPVLDPEGAFAGVISYEEVKNTLYDPVLRGLVIADDLTAPIDDPLAPGDSLALALERLDRHRVESWPVVEDGRLVGVARRSDLYALMRRDLAQSRGEPS